MRRCSALAFADARAVGARGDDWTGFLLAPAGAALVALGLATLWQSRKPNGRRYLRRALLGVGAVVGVGRVPPSRRRPISAGPTAR